MDRLSVGEQAIDRVLHLYALSAPQAADRAAVALAFILQHLRNSTWKEVVWEFSYLTGGGFPVEFTFSSSNDTVSYASEVAPPEVNTSLRLLYAKDLLSSLGATPLPQEVYQQLLALQDSSRLVYGAWIAGRHDAQQDRYKLYAEVPQTNQSYAYEMLGKFVQTSWHTNPAIIPKMIGYDLSAKRVEFYFRMENLSTWDLPAIMNAVGFAKHAGVFLHFIRKISTRSGDVHFLGANTGFSLAFTSEGTPLAFSLFAFARSVFRGGDAWIRAHLMEQNHLLGGSWQTYAQVSELLANSNTRNTYHGMVTFTVTLEGKTAFQIGLRPPALKGGIYAQKALANDQPSPHE